MEHITFGLLLLANSLSPASAIATTTGGDSVQATSTVVSASSTPTVLVAATTEDIVRSTFKDTPTLIAIANCESHFRHVDKDGQILRGVANSDDIGVMQINEIYHLEKAKKLGLDIYSLDGNMKYAQYLFDKEGGAPWNASKKCWAPIVKAQLAKAIKQASPEVLAQK